MVPRLSHYLILGVLMSGLVPSLAPALSILSGSDYLSTVDDTAFLDLSLLDDVPLPPIPPIPPDPPLIIPLEGLSNGPGNADTIIRRLEDGEIPDGDDTVIIDIELVGLSLVSVNTYMYEGNIFDLEIGLSAVPSLGEMTIRLLDDTEPSGTFESFLDLLLKIALIDSNGDVAHTFEPTAFRLESSGTWSSTPPPGAVLVPGAPGNPAANYHPTSTGHDFFITSSETEFGGPGLSYSARTAVVPVPSSLGLTTVGFLVLFGIRRRAFVR